MFGQSGRGALCLNVKAADQKSFYLLTYLLIVIRLPCWPKYTIQQTITQLKAVLLLIDCGLYFLSDAMTD